MSIENRNARKPPVRAINGSDPAHDLVTDADYAEAVAAQDAVLFAQGRERKVLGQLRYRLAHGATDAGLMYYFDNERGIVRRKLRKEG